MNKIKALKNIIVEHMYAYVDNLDKNERDKVLKETDECLNDLVAEVEMETRKIKNKDCGILLLKK